MNSLAGSGCRSPARAHRTDDPACSRTVARRPGSGSRKRAGVLVSGANESSSELALTAPPRANRERSERVRSTRRTRGEVWGHCARPEPPRATSRRAAASGGTERGRTLGPSRATQALDRSERSERREARSEPRMAERPGAFYRVGVGRAPSNTPEQRGLSTGSPSERSRRTHRSTPRVHRRPRSEALRSTNRETRVTRRSRAPAGTCYGRMECGLRGRPQDG
jgi:hypothetical protein